MMLKGKCESWIKCGTVIAEKLLGIADRFKPYAHDLIGLALRLWIGLIFWKSGVTKLGNWDSTLFLFEYEYQVPLLPVQFAAVSSTITELTMPFLLFIGLGARIAAIPLIVMTAVIQFTYQMHHQHVEWVLALLAIMVLGSGRFSWDFFIRRHLMNDTGKLSDKDTILCGVVTAVLTLFFLHEVAALGIDAIDPWLDGTLEWWNNFAGQHKS